MKTSLANLVSVLCLAGCLGNGEVKLVQTAEPPPAAPPVAPVTAPVKSAAGLKLSIAPVTPMVSVGQTFDVEVQVHNVGDGIASGVAPSTPFQTGLGHALLVAPPTPGITDLGPNELRTFRFGYLATDPGGINFAVDAAGTDIANDRAISAVKQNAQLVVEAAAALAIDAIELPAQVNLGADVTVKLTVSNPGQASALAIKPALTANAAFTTLAAATPAQADLTGARVATFTWIVRPSAAGPIVFKGTAEGLDGHSHLPITVTAAAMPLQVDSPADLEVMASLPQAASSGQTFVATVVVTNNGTSIAKGVSPVGAPQLTLTGTATATFTTSPIGAQDIPGGSSATFRWTLAAGGIGSITLRTAFTGTDGNSNAPLTPPTSTSNALQVLAPTALVVAQISAPTSIGRGQGFNVQVTVRNNGGSPATAVSATPSPLAVIATGGAAATMTMGAAPQDLAAGAQGVFTFAYVETGTATGTLAFSAGATGTGGNGATVAAPSVQSPLLQVVTAAALLTETVGVPAKVSRGQTFDVVVTVLNSGGASISAVRPAVTFTGAATVTAGAAPATVALAPGARATIRVPFTAGTASSGALTASVISSGTSALGGTTVNAPAKSSTAVLVQSPAQLSIASFTLPASIDRGSGFTLSLRVTNTGEADAVAVTPVPSPPMAVVTGGVLVATTTTAAPVTIAGTQSQTFTWIYTESGSAPGTLAFNAGASGKDANTLADLFVAPLNSNSSSVATPVGCNGAALYVGVGGASLDGDRIDVAPNTNRLRIKPYSMLPAEYSRVLASTPSRIQNQAQTFDAPTVRWAKEQQLSGVSLYQAFLASFQGCLTFVAAPTQYSAAPTATTAATECANFQRRFWSAIPTAAETQICTAFATSTINNDADPRRRWAYVCASVLTSAQFLAD